MGSALAVGSVPSTSRAADGRQRDDGHGGHADEAAAEAAAGYDGHEGGGGADGDGGEDDDEADAAVVAELAGWAALLLTDEETVIATDAAFPSPFNCFASNSIQPMLNNNNNNNWKETCISECLSLLLSASGLFSSGWTENGDT